MQCIHSWPSLQALAFYFSAYFFAEMYCFLTVRMSVKLWHRPSLSPFRATVSILSWRFPGAKAFFFYVKCESSGGVRGKKTENVVTGLHILNLR